MDASKVIVYSWGKGSSGCLGIKCEEDIDTPSPLTLSIEENITTVVTGRNHVFAINEDKDCIYAWGNYYNELIDLISATKRLKGNPKVFNTNGIVINTLKAKNEIMGKNGNSYYPNFADPYLNACDLNIKGPLEIHDEMKKQTNVNRIEIKTLEDEDLDEMNDCEIEVDADDILPEESKQEKIKDFEKLPYSHEKKSKHSNLVTFRREKEIKNKR